MSCTALAQGFIPKTCKTVSGTKKFMIIEFENIDVAGIVRTANVITTLPKLDGSRFWEYNQKAEVANWKETGSSTTKEGAFKFEQTATFDLNSLDTLSRKEAVKLLKKTLMVIACDNDGTFWLLGEDYGMDVTSLGTDGGVDFSSFRGSKVELKAMGFTEATEIDDAIIADLLVVTPI